MSDKPETNRWEKKGEPIVCRHGRTHGEIFSSVKKKKKKKKKKRKKDGGDSKGGQ